jgi:predicted MFS family arabinose efflux permease
MTASTRPVALALGGCIAMAAAMGVGRFVYTPILPYMAEALDLSKSEAGLIASANYAGYLTGALLASLPFLRGSRRAWLLGALIASAATTGATGLLSDMPVFLTVRFLGGVASAMVLIYASTLVMERLYAARRPGLSAIHFAGVGVGIAASALIVSGLAAFEYGWREQWIVSGLISLIAAAVAATLIPNQAEPALTARRGTVERGLAPLIAAYGLFGFGYVITATFLVAIVRDSPEIAPLEPLIWLVVGLTVLPSVVIWNWLGVRLGTLQAYTLATVLLAIGVAASVLWVTPAGALLAATLLGGTFMAMTALGLAGAREITAGDPRRALALMSAAFALGQIIGPIFAGHLYDLTGSFLSASLAATGALLVSAVLAMKTARG